MKHPESTRLSRRRLLALASISAGGALLAQRPLFADQGGAGPATASATTNPKDTSFGPRKQIDAGLLNVGYAEAGPPNGPAVILLQGWPFDIYSYVDVAPLLASAGYRVIVPYLRGFGTTQFLSGDTFRNGQQSVVALDIIALMDALKIDKAILAGFDWGGRTADIMAVLRPERPPQTLVITHRALRRFHQQLTQEPVALLADSAQPLLAARAVFARNQPYIAGHLLAPRKPRSIANGRRKRQRRDRAHSRLRPHELRHFVSLRKFFRRPIQRCDLFVQIGLRLQQVLPPAPGPARHRQLTQRALSRFAPQLTLLLHPTIHRQVLQGVLHPRATLHQLVPMDQQLPYIPLLGTRSPPPRKPVLP